MRENYKILSCDQRIQITKAEGRMNFVALFALDMGKDQFEVWLTANRGRRLVLEEFQLDSATPFRGLVRSPLVFGVRHIFGRWQPSCAVGTEVKVEVEYWSCLQL